MSHQTPETRSSRDAHGRQSPHAGNQAAYLDSGRVMREAIAMPVTRQTQPTLSSDEEVPAVRDGSEYNKSSNRPGIERENGEMEDEANMSQGDDADDDGADSVDGFLERLTKAEDRDDKTAAIQTAPDGATDNGPLGDFPSEPGKASEARPGSENATQEVQVPTGTESLSPGVKASENSVVKPRVMRIKPSNKIDLDKPTTWTKSQLRAALQAVGMKNVYRITAKGKRGRYVLASLLEDYDSPEERAKARAVALAMSDGVRMNSEARQARVLTEDSLTPPSPTHDEGRQTVVSRLPMLSASRNGEVCAGSGNASRSPQCATDARVSLESSSEAHRPPPPGGAPKGPNTVADSDYNDAGTSQGGTDWGDAGETRIPQGAVDKLQAMINMWGRDYATKKDTLLYGGISYDTQEVLDLIPHGDVEPVPERARKRRKDHNVVSGRNGIFRLLNILFQPEVRERLRESELRASQEELDRRAASDIDGFWMSVRDMLLDPQHDAGGLLHGERKKALLEGFDPGVVDMPLTTTPSDIKHMYYKTRSEYEVAKAGQNTACHDKFEPFCHGQADVFYLHLLMEHFGSDAEEIREDVPDSVHQAAESVEDADESGSSAVKIGRARRGSHKDDGALEIKEGLIRLGSELAQALRTVRSAAKPVAAPVASGPGLQQHAAGNGKDAGLPDKAEKELRLWDYYNRFRKMLKEMEEECEEDRDEMAVKHLRKRKQEIFDEIMAL